MKQILFLLLLGLSIKMHSQEYINIGSTKQNVKDVQGEPVSIESYEGLGEEIWGYGESGIASVTFKNGKVKSFRNYQNILRIGDIKYTPSKSKKESDNDIIKQIFKRAGNYPPSQEANLTKGTKSPSGLGFRAGSESATLSPDLSPKTRKLAIELNWDPNSMTSEEMEKAASEILFERNMRSLFIFLGISLVAILVYFKYFRKKLNK
ncbi:hypothetical protein C8J95_1128 [Elizabethkingia sp. YR214]|uniref:hypothetical protein n=1 Tax=Elizabethkingia sp. YR214 TaxID=2135667 RepID=UPI000D4B2C33|nr:hypothetical protein [Elizabethkingia sp. YR214]PUB25845.1 hypothetical protein C8J95_1128 [Elizabethkingia sp. YR214]